MDLYKFRSLGNCKDLERILSIIEDGFYCCDFLNFNDVNEGVFYNSQNSSNVNLDQKIQYRICSFSMEKALESQLMWGHYANAGMGVVLKIKIDSQNDFYDVNYEEEKEYGDVIKILTNKSSVWAYEDEKRFIKNTTDVFLKKSVTKIYFGTPYKNLSNYEEIKSKHIKLKKYLKLSDQLRNECKNQNICCEDYQLYKKT